MPKADAARSFGHAVNGFPDRWYADGNRSRLLIFALPLLYLATTLLYSTQLAPWGRQVDPESVYAMNGLIMAAGYPSMMFGHPGTTTTLLVEIIIRVWALVVRPEDIVAFGFRNFDAIVYAARTCEALILTGVLIAGGHLVGCATRSVQAALLFQVAPFVHFDTFHFEMVLIPEALMASAAILSMALLVKTALDPNPPTVRLGVASGLIFAFGFSSKYLFLPFAVLGINLLGNRRAFIAAGIAGTIGFIVFNLVLNPGAITRGFGWMFSIATHKGSYGLGEPGYVDLNVFWPNMAKALTAAPLVSGLYVVAALLSLARMLQSRGHFDPVSRALLSAFVIFAAQLVATSKHFALHYMMASWVLAGGVLVLTIVQLRRVASAIPAGPVAAAAAALCAFLIATTLSEARREAVETAALDDAAARLSRAVRKAGPACANVASMHVRAPENQMSFGWVMTMFPWGDQPMKDRFSASYARAFETPLLDQSDYSPALTRNFLPHSYAKLAAEYPCIIVRSQRQLNRENSSGLVELNPDHCRIGHTHVYAVGIACSQIQSAFAGG